MKTRFVTVTVVILSSLAVHASAADDAKEDSALNGPWIQKTCQQGGKAVENSSFARCHFSNDMLLLNRK